MHENATIIRLDTYVGMGMSNLVALFIILRIAATLRGRGITDTQSSCDAAGRSRTARLPGSIGRAGNQSRPQDRKKLGRFRLLKIGGYNSAI
ncbi:MAG: hypothetical protein JWM91_1207 [Rhodospirillales bacterium]|nr:hypothetical protein [Rhodospirillales bacterium]